MKSRRAINFFTATFLSIRVRYVYLCVDNCFSRKKKLERCENRKRIISLFGKLRRDRSVVSIKFSLEFQRPGDREIEVGRCWPRVKESFHRSTRRICFHPIGRHGNYIGIRGSSDESKKQAVLLHLSFDFLLPFERIRSQGRTFDLSSILFNSSFLSIVIK